jgi:serine/threonine protein kinase
MTLTLNEFVSVAKESRLVNPDLLDSMLGEVEAMGRSEDTHALASRLVGRGALTNWQSEKLLNGVSSGFFLGKYKLQRLIASGSMSSVYEAEHILLRKRFALKVLPKALVGEASFLERFYREARAVVRLDHTNIIRGFDVGQEGDYHFFVMEFLEGSSFQDLVEKSGPVSPSAAAGMIRQAAIGLDHAHQAGMIHRDIKPANLLLSHDGVVKVLDLGLVRSLPQETDGEAGLTRIHDERMLGTVDYLSPEQAIDSHNVDIRSDIYSLGCTFYFLLSGDPPFAKGTLTERLLAHQTRSAIPITVIRPDVPASLGRILSKMLEKRPDARFQAPAEVALALEEWLKSQAEPKPNDSSEVSLAMPWFASNQRDLSLVMEAPATAPARIAASESKATAPGRPRSSSVVRKALPGPRPPSSLLKGRKSNLASTNGPTLVLGRALWEPWSHWASAVEALASNSALRFTPSQQSYQNVFDDLMRACREVGQDADEPTQKIIREINDITAPWMNLQTLRSILQSEMKYSIVQRVRELDKLIMSSREPEEPVEKPRQLLLKVAILLLGATMIGAALLCLAPDPSESEVSNSWIAQTRQSLKKQLSLLTEKIASH